MHSTRQYLVEAEVQGVYIQVQVILTFINFQVVEKIKAIIKVWSNVYVY